MDYPVQKSAKLHYRLAESYRQLQEFGKAERHFNETLCLLKRYPAHTDKVLADKSKEGLRLCNAKITPKPVSTIREIAGIGKAPKLISKLPQDDNAAPILAAANVHSPPKVKMANLGTEKGWRPVAAVDIKPGKLYLSAFLFATWGNSCLFLEVIMK